MADKIFVQKMLREMGEDYSKNVNIIKEHFENWNMDMKDALFVLTDNLYNEESCLLALTSLLVTGNYNPNERNVLYKNFIDNAIDKGYSVDFICKLVDFCLGDSNMPVKLDINSQDGNGKTIMHNVLYSEDCNGNIVKLYKLLIDNSFDSSIKDDEGRNVFFALAHSVANGKKYKNAAEFKYVFNEWGSNNYKELFNSIFLCTDKIGFEEGINQLLKELSGDVNKDYLYLFYSGDYLKLTVSELCRTLLSMKRESNKVLYAIKSALNKGYYSNNFIDNAKNNAVQLAIHGGYDEEFVINLIKLILECEKKDKKFDINHVNEEGLTMLHTAIYSNSCNVDIPKLYKFFLEKGFDSNIRDKDSRNIVDAMSYMQEKYKKYTDEDIAKVMEVMSESSLYGRQGGYKKMGVSKEIIQKILDRMTENLEANKDAIADISSMQKGLTCNDLLYSLTMDLYDENECFYAIKTLIKLENSDPNYTPLHGQNNFIQNAI